MGNLLTKHVEGGDPDFKISVTVGTESVTLPLEIGGTYNFTVNYGDGSGDKTITAYNDVDATHSYSAGTYEISFSGTYTHFRVGNGAFKTKIVDIINWGTQTWTLINFWGCSNLAGTLTATDIPDMSAVTVFQDLFKDCSALVAIPNIADWDTSSVTNMQYAFEDCTLFNSDLTNWDVSSVTTFSHMFDDARAFNGNVDGWTLKSSGTIDCSYMFVNAWVFDRDISGWNTQYVTTFAQFCYLAKVFNQDLSSWNLTNCTDMFYMFRQATLQNCDYSSWQIQNVTDMTLWNWSTALSTANYDLLLVAWALLSVQSNVPMRVSAQYTIATSQASRDVLTGAPNNWTITDGGGI